MSDMIIRDQEESGESFSKIEGPTSAPFRFRPPLRHNGTDPATLQHNSAQLSADKAGPANLSTLVNDSMTEMIELQTKINSQNHVRLDEKVVFRNPSNYFDFHQHSSKRIDEKQENNPHLVYQIQAVSPSNLLNHTFI